MCCKIKLIILQKTQSDLWSYVIIIIFLHHTLLVALSGYYFRPDLSIKCCFHHKKMFGDTVIT